MNYIILKWIIDATLANYKCKECSSWIVEWNIFILGLAGNSVNLEVICPNCNLQWLVKAEVWFINQITTPESLNNLKNSFANIQQMNINNANSIKETDILSIRENLKNCSSIEDLFNN